MMESTAAALLSALLFAVTTNLQRLSASAVHHDHGPLRLLRHLLTDARWLAGGVVGIVAFGLHAVALARGSVTVVQAVMALGLVLVLALESARERRPLHPREVGGALLIVAGVSVVVACSAGHPDGASSGAALVVALAVVALTFGAVAASRAGVDLQWGSRVLAALGGACFAVDAVFLQRIASLLDTREPLGALLGADPLVVALDVLGFAAGSAAGTVSIHRAYQVATLRQVQPALASAEPVTAFLLGVVVLGEGVRWGTLGYLVAVAGLAALTVGILVGLGGQAAGVPPKRSAQGWSRSSSVAPRSAGSSNAAASRTFFWTATAAKSASANDIP